MARGPKGWRGSGTCGYRYGDGRPVLGRKWCKGCGKWRLLIDFNAEKRTKRGVAYQWASNCITCNNRRQAERLKDPGQRKRYREYQRMWTKSKRGSPGLTLLDQPEVVGGNRSSNLDAGPLIVAVERWHANQQAMRSDFYTYSDTAGLPATIADLCDLAGISDRSWRRIRTEGRVSLDVADRLIVAMGLYFDEVYDEECPPQAA